MSEGLGRLDSGDRATAEPIVRYQRDRPGELAKRSSTGYRFRHSALDDRTRIVYSEIHANEQAVTAVGFWVRANAFYNTLGIVVERVITGNGPCYRSRL